MTSEAVADLADPAGESSTEDTSGSNRTSEIRRVDVRPLVQLWPLLRAHWGDAAFSLVALLFSTSATLGFAGALRLVVDRGFGSASPAALNETFLVLIAVALVLAMATA